MGVPSFYRWLVGKYPNIVAPAKANDITYDNLYLDMNGIIHLCFHPDDQRMCPPTTFDEVFRYMLEYMDRLFRIVRPRRLLYLAVDGVVPRAKMNQQRATRFKSAKAAKEAEMEENLLRERFRAQGKEVLPRDETCEVSDPNVIAPGTEFMEKLSAALEYYIRSRLSTDPRWKRIKVILSDANVPGEAKHKIMSFIRGQRSMENYDPNTFHCFYGLDADLIMLALASHEVHFSILREAVLRQNQPEICVPVTEKEVTTQELAKVECRGSVPWVTEDALHQNQLNICAPITENKVTTEERVKVEPRGWFPRVTEASPKGKLPYKLYQFLDIWVLRDYLELEMKIPDCKYDIERIIDDFIFICLLVENDYIPHIPSLEIHEHAVDLLIEVYKTTFNKMGGYIVDTEKVKDKHAAYLTVLRLEEFFHELSLHEEKIFLKRYELREKFLCKIQRQAAENEWNERNSDNVVKSSNGPDLMSKLFSTQDNISTCSSDKSDATENTSELRRKLKDTLHTKQDIFKNGTCKHDMIRLGLPGWKSRFYREKFGANFFNEVGRLQTEMVQKYLEGLCWVIQYYFSDVPSWSWYYPYYYAPFTSDLKRLSQFKISFTVDKPLRPFDHLMAVLPPESSCALPKCYRKLMGCEESTIQMFYPSELEIDTDGKRFLWQGVAKLPFIDEKLLLSATKTIEKELTMHEMRRNTIRQEKIFLRNSNTLANNAAFALMSDNSPKTISTREIGGCVSPDDAASSDGLFRSPIKDMQDITYDRTISAMFFNPEAVKPISRLLDNVIVPDKTVTEDDIPKRPLWHTYPGPRPPPVTYKPQTPWKASSPSMPKEEFKSAGTGWMGRGRGSAAAAAAETQQIGWSSYGWGRGKAETQQIGGSSYGRGRGDAETQQIGVSRYGRGFHGVDTAQSRGSRFDGGAHGRGGEGQKQETAWRPSGPWTRGGGGGGNGRGRGGSGQPRAW